MVIEDDPPDSPVDVAPLSEPISHPRRVRRRRVVLATVLFLGVVFIALTARLFVWPERGVPAHADAIVVFSGEGDRLSVGVKLASSGVSRNLVLSVDSAYTETGGRCPTIAGVTVYCFVPDPSTTQGEARHAAQLAAKYHWRSLILVTNTPQDTRARLRMSRCYGGKVYVATSPLPGHEWPGAVLYEWGATLKALLLQRSC